MIRLEIELGHGGARTGLREEETDRKIGQTVAYMVSHLNQPLPVAELASLANVSPSHFFTLFKRRTGCTPIDFFIRLRMHQACRLLEWTSLNVKEVAAALGYDDQFYFSRVFKSVNQVAPSEFRLRPVESRETMRNALLPQGGQVRFNIREVPDQPATDWHAAAELPAGKQTAVAGNSRSPEPKQWNASIVPDMRRILHSPQENLCQAG